jgi:hypothetical protein
VVVVTVVVEVVVAAGKAKLIFLQLLAAVNALVGIAGRTASKATAIDIFSGREKIFEL